MIKAETKRNEMVVGAFVVLGFIFLTLILFFVSGVYLFRPGYKLNIIYEYVSILDKGAPIRMAGVRVGEVDKVELYYDEATKKTRVRVRLFIEKNIEIRENYTFKIQGTHVLSEPHIEITPKPGTFPVLKNGDVIEGITPIAVEALIEKANEISEKISEILSNFQNTLQDSDASLKTMITNLAGITESLNKALSGTDKELKQTIINLNNSTESLDKVLDQVESGNGTVGGLLMKDEIYKDMRALVSDIKAHPWKLLKKDSSGKKFLFF